MNDTLLLIYAACIIISLVVIIFAQHLIIKNKELIRKDNDLQGDLKNPFPPLTPEQEKVFIKIKCGESVPESESPYIYDRCMSHIAEVDRYKFIPAPEYIHSPKIPIQKINELADENGYKTIDYQKNIGMISFSKDDIRINIYLTKMTVTTVLNHPKLGSNSLYRKNVSYDELKQIFINPRTHTNKGYR